MWTFFSLDLNSRLHRLPKRAMADPNSAEVTDELLKELQLAQHRMLEQRRLSNSDVYVAQQHLWFEQRNKRGPPSTAVSSMATPQEEGQDQIAGAGSAARPEGSISSLFQPLPVATEASFSITAAHAGVDINDGSALQAWMQAPVTTRQDFLQTLRKYHVSVMWPEVYHMIAQVENIIAKLDDRMLRIQENMNWLASKNRAAQKREARLIVLLTGLIPRGIASCQARSNQLDASTARRCEAVPLPETVQRHRLLPPVLLFSSAD